VRRIFNADDAAEADRRLKATVARYHKTAPDLANWLEANIPEALTVFALPAAHRRRLRTTNGLERLNKEIKRRTRVATLFPNEASVLRLVSAVLSEISDDWETERAYLNMKARSPARSYRHLQKRGCFIRQDWNLGTSGPKAAIHRRRS
jgi:putative transposase